MLLYEKKCNLSFMVVKKNVPMTTLIFPFRLQLVFKCPYDNTRKAIIPKKMRKIRQFCNKKDIIKKHKVTYLQEISHP